MKPRCPVDVELLEELGDDAGYTPDPEADPPEPDPEAEFDSHTARAIQTLVERDLAQDDCLWCRGVSKAHRRPADHCRRCGAHIHWPRLDGALIFGDRSAECSTCAERDVGRTRMASA